MKVQEVITRALDDKKFAEQLKGDATKAARGGATAAEWKQLMSHFAESPAELATLSSIPAKGAARRGGEQDLRTWLTILTLTSLACTGTSSSTTTTW